MYAKGAISDAGAYSRLFIVRKWAKPEVTPINTKKNSPFGVGSTHTKGKVKLITRDPTSKT